MRRKKAEMKWYRSKRSCFLCSPCCACICVYVQVSDLPVIQLCVCLTAPAPVICFLCSCNLVWTMLIFSFTLKDILPLQYWLYSKLNASIFLVFPPFCFFMFLLIHILMGNSIIFCPFIFLSVSCTIFLLSHIGFFILNILVREVKYSFKPICHKSVFFCMSYF